MAQIYASFHTVKITSEICIKVCAVQWIPEWQKKRYLAMNTRMFYFIRIKWKTTNFYTQCLSKKPTEYYINIYRPIRSFTWQSNKRHFCRFVAFSKYVLYKLWRKFEMSIKEIRTTLLWLLSLSLPFQRYSQGTVACFLICSVLQQMPSFLSFLKQLENHPF